MGRRQEIQEDDILHAAREVFLTQGVHATTLEVARRAKISEASVFKRFRTKDALFCAAMRPHLDVPPLLASLPGRAGERTVGALLEETGAAVMEFMRVVLPMMMMAWSNRVERPSELTGRASQRETLRPLVAFAKREIELGRLRAVGAETFARAFLGGIADYVVTDTLRQGVYVTTLSPQRYLRGLVDLLLHGAEGAAEPPPGGRRGVKKGR
jgi:AcrR family transcriptional regulator